MSSDRFLTLSSTLDLLKNLGLQVITNEAKRKVRVILPNKYEISIAFGTEAYGFNRTQRFDLSYSSLLSTAHTFEVEVFNPRGRSILGDGWPDFEYDDGIIGHCTVDELLYTINRVASNPAPKKKLFGLF